MERWLTKTRVLVTLSIALLSAALNRSEPLVWGLFLFMVCLGSLGFALPWAALRRIRLSVAGAGEVVEGNASTLALVIEQRGWWPVFMVDVQTCWTWAGRDIVLRQLVPALRRGRPVDLGERMRFACRGHYRLREARLSCGFPLGLLDARLNVAGLAAAFVVLPRAAPCVMPVDLPVAADDRGQQVTRRLGLSHELGLLRDLEPAEPVRRIHWRASARAGRLIVQQYLQSGSPLLRVVVKIPDADEVAHPDSAGEQAVRAAAGLCRSALADGLRVRAYVVHDSEPLVVLDEIDRALAVATPGSLPLRGTLAQAADDMQDGDLLVVVLPETASSADLLSALPDCVGSQMRLQALVARPRLSAADQATSESPLTAALHAAGVDLWPNA
jgi:uncharacterized protein (DUF58 family)